MQGDRNAATLMLGLPGFVLLAVSELGSEIEYAIETSDMVTGCADCGVLAGPHDRLTAMCEICPQRAGR